MAASSSSVIQNEPTEETFSYTRMMHRLKHLLHTNIMVDVVFLVGEERKRIYGHKFLLSIVSKVFHTLFHGSLPVMNEVVERDIEPEIFQNMITFMYTGEIELNGDNVMRTIYAAKKYLVLDLQNTCEVFLTNELCEDNALLLLEHAKFFDLRNLAQECWNLIDREPAACLASEYFEEISYATLVNILSRNRLDTREIVLYNAMKRWALAECHRLNLPVDKVNLRDVLKDCINMISYTSMSWEEYASGPKTDRILTKQQRRMMRASIRGRPMCHIL